MPDPSVSTSEPQQTKCRSGEAPEDMDSAVILCFFKENKTRTKDTKSIDTTAREQPVAPLLGLKRSWRQVVDFGDPKSSGVGEMWGYKTVSVPWVSILDAETADGDEPPG